MTKILLAIALLISFISFTSATTTYLTDTENGHSYNVMKVVLDGKSNIVVSAVKSGTPAQSLETLMDNVGGTHAINGGFFCPADYGCNPPVTSALRIVNGTSLGGSLYGQASLFGFDSNGAPLLVTKSADIKKIYNGMSMQTLVQDGVNVAVLNGTMNSDAKQGKAGNKTFICSTQDNNVVYMGYVNGVTFSTVADYIIQTFDCYNAIQLDNGGTKAMIYKGEYVAKPGRNMMDAFVIIEGNNVGTIVPPATAITISPEELSTAVNWMYNAGLTSKSTVTDFLPNDTMTREQASKFFSVFAEKVFEKVGNDNIACTFSDIGKSDPTLSSNIIDSCKLDIFKGSNGKFDPKSKLTNAQAITVLMRIMIGTMPEPSTAFYTNYLLKCKELGLVGNINVKANITRGEAAILLYKANAYREKTKTPSDTDTDVNVDQPTLTTPILCTYGQHKENNICVSNIKNCTITNGLGQKNWTNNARGSCILASCNNGYQVQNNSCILANTTPTCTSAQHIENNTCVSNTRSCTITNGIGQQTRANSIRGVCSVVSCNNGYQQQNNNCSIVIAVPTCTTTQHLENNICVSNTKSCIITNGIGQQSWVNNTRGDCLLVSCNDGYQEIAGVCIPAACTTISCLGDQVNQNLNQNISGNTRQCFGYGPITNQYPAKGYGIQALNDGVWGVCMLDRCSGGCQQISGGCTLKQNSCFITKVACATGLSLGYRRLQDDLSYGTCIQ